MKNSNRVGCIIFIVLGAMVLIAVLILGLNSTRYDKTGCKYGVYQDCVEVSHTDTVYDYYGRIRECVFVRYHRGDSVVVRSEEIEDWIIGVYVIDVKYGSRSNPFMLIAQKPEKDVDAAHGSIYYGTYDARLKFIKDYPYFKYWIIKFDTDDVYGPFTEEEYLLKRKELGVGEELKLSFEEKAK